MTQEVCLAARFAAQRDAPPDPLYIAGLIAEESPVFARRLRAAAAREGKPDPIRWVAEHRYALANQPGWAAAVQYWLNFEPGRTWDGWQQDASVISDGQIIAGIQALR